MSHSIKAFAGGQMITRLDFSAGNRVTASYAYRCLHAEDFDNGVSGNGYSKQYTLPDIQVAKQALRYYAKEPYASAQNVENDRKQNDFIDNTLESFYGKRVVVNSDKKTSPEEAIQQIDAFLSDIIDYGKNVSLRFG